MVHPKSNTPIIPKDAHVHVCITNVKGKAAMLWNWERLMNMVLGSQDLGYLWEQLPALHTARSSIGELGP